MKILITAGATREPIDKVRFITNMSSGRTGAAMASTLQRLGHDVTYLHGEGAALPAEKIETLEFKSFRDLDQKISWLLKERPFDVVIHLAAVSDYSVESVASNGKILNTAEGKLASGAPLEIRLKPNHKILNRIKTYAGSHAPLVVGFKLTTTGDGELRSQAVEKLFHDGGVDLVVHNDLKDMEEQKQHQFHIYDKIRKVGDCVGAEALARRLLYDAHP
jgi:phosphopantothenoylcysteine decarboxylase/phosphopantothenate--cysteine ligase